jgi:hypothetical protein
LYNDKIGLAVWKANKRIYRTLDGGETWNSFSTNLAGGWVGDIEFFPDDPSKILICFGSYLDCQLGLIEGNHLVYSSDTGKTWIELTTPDIGIFRDIEMVDSQHGWIVGEKGIIHLSTGAISSANIEKTLDLTFALNQNFPNPFNSRTRITFNIERPDIVSLMIYNLVGEEVTSLLKNIAYSIGYHSLEFDADGLSNGIYFYQLITSQGIQTKRMIILK